MPLSSNEIRPRAIAIFQEGETGFSKNAEAKSSGNVLTLDASSKSLLAKQNVLISSGTKREIQGGMFAEQNKRSKN